MYIIPSVPFHFLPYWSTENHKYHCTVSLTSINKNKNKTKISDAVLVENSVLLVENSVLLVYYTVHDVMFILKGI